MIISPRGFIAVTDADDGGFVLVQVSKIKRVNQVTQAMRNATAFLSLPVGDNVKAVIQLDSTKNNSGDAGFYENSIGVTEDIGTIAILINKARN